MIAIRNIFIMFNVLSVALGRHTVKIIEGEVADIRDFPYMAAKICLRDGLICGTSIINENTLLLAAHCVFDVDPPQLRISYGSTNFHEGLVTNVSKIIVHENYTGVPPYRDDIAVLKVDPPIVFSETAQPIKLAQKNVPNPRGKLAKVSGWGDTDVHSSYSNILQKVNETIIDNITCENDYKDTDFYVDSEIQICAQADMSDGKRRGICNGDSGGPLVIDGVQYGIVSFGACGYVQYPDVFTRVAHYIDWLTDKL